MHTLLAFKRHKGNIGVGTGGGGQQGTGPPPKIIV